MSRYKAQFRKAFAKGTIRPCPFEREYLLKNRDNIRELLKSCDVFYGKSGKLYRHFVIGKDRMMIQLKPYRVGSPTRLQRNMITDSCTGEKRKRFGAFFRRLGDEKTLEDILGPPRENTLELAPFAPCSTPPQNFVIPPIEALFPCYRLPPQWENRGFVLPGLVTLQ
jgi:hypothetical protein